MEKKVIKKKGFLEDVQVVLPSDVGTSIESIVFNSRSIKPNPFIVKQPETKHRL